MSSDSENTMTGRHTSFVTRMIACAKNPVLRIWCALHQIDLVVKSAAEELAGVLQGSSPQDRGVRQDAPSRADANKRVVGHHVRGVTGHQCHQCHVRHFAKPVAVDHAAGATYPHVDQLAGRHVLRRDRTRERRRRPVRVSRVDAYPGRRERRAHPRPGVVHDRLLQRHHSHSRDVCNLAGHRLMGVKAERDGNNMRLEKAMRHLCYPPS
ncbi:unnamed protein product [Sphagnum jensenii]